MFIKINTKNKQKLAINKFFHVLPPFLLGFATFIFGIVILLFSQIKTFAAPGTPSGAPGIMDFSVNKPTIDLHFTSSEAQSNTLNTIPQFYGIVLIILPVFLYFFLVLMKILI